jgi:shikimate dehydrogenase
VIGRPIDHSLSPAMHNAAFEALDLPWTFLAVSVPEGHARDAIDVMRAVPFAGMSVTMPHKSAVATLVDTCTPIASALDAVNCVWWRGETLVGDNTDGAGFLDALRNDEGFDPEGCRSVVLGAGGAARAVVRALADGGAAEVVVVNRTSERAEVAAGLAGAVGRVGTADAVDGAELVVNATSVGMGVGAGPGGEVPLDVDRLGPGQLVVDLIYEPATTALVAAARDRGAVGVNGLGMLINQAAHAFRSWTGEDPPVEVMSAAATAELARRATGEPNGP